jgi:hypothetical protein
MTRTHATKLAAEVQSATAEAPSTARPRAKPLRREHVPGYARAIQTSAFVTLVHTRIHASVRRLAKLLHVAPSRAHLLTDDMSPQSITVADVLFLATSTNDEGSAIARGIWRDVGAPLNAAAKARSATPIQQLDLFNTSNPSRGETR